MSALARAATLALVLAVSMSAATAVTASAQPSLASIEREVMCPSCGESLAVSNSSQADRERALIRRMLARGAGTRAIKAELVRQFGPTVLGLPPRRGFDGVVYAIPIALAVVLIAGLGATARRWRRRGSRPPVLTPLSEADLERLAADLASYDL